MAFGARHSLARLVGCCALLLVPLVASAQAEAPLAWGPMRVLMNAYPQINALSQHVRAWGDTIVLTGAVDPGGGDRYGAVCVTGNNGQTWSPWRVFVAPNNWGLGHAWPVATEHGLFVAAQAADGRWGLYRTTTLGQSWQPPLSVGDMLNQCQSYGDTIAAVCAATVTWTANGGRTWAAGRPIVPALAHTELAVGAEHVHVAVSWYGPHIQYSRAPLASGPFEGPWAMNPQLEWPHLAGVEFDREGRGLLATVAFYTPHEPTYGALFVNRTTDDGLTWSEMDTVVAVESVAGYVPEIAVCGPLWAIAWCDSTRTIPPYEYLGMWVRFSANHGRSWYPHRQVSADSIYGGGLAGLDVRPTQIRLYVNVSSVQGQYGRFYLQYEGQITPDTEPPVMVGQALPELVPCDTAVTFSASAEDNDSLWRIEVVLWPEGGTDTLRLPLVADAPHRYRGSWTTPADTGRWFYAYRAEDMWEHVSVFPEGEPGSVDVGAITDTDDPFLPHPSFFRISVYPNPSNSTTTLRFTLPVLSEVCLTLYDVTGRVVMVRDLGRLSAGEHAERIEAERLASGIYFASLRAGARNIVRKIALVR